MDSVASAGNHIAESSPTLTASLLRAPAPTPAGFVDLSRFVVANSMKAEVRAAFSARPHLVDHAAGFCRMEGLRLLDRPQEILLVTLNSRCDYRTWRLGLNYRESHYGISKDLKPVGRGTCIRELEIVCE